MFGARYFAPRYFGARYFGQNTEGAVVVVPQEDMAAHRPRRRRRGRRLPEIERGVYVKSATREAQKPALAQEKPSTPFYNQQTQTGSGWAGEIGGLDIPTYMPPNDPNREKMTKALRAAIDFFGT